MPIITLEDNPIIKIDGEVVDFGQVLSDQKDEAQAFNNCHHTIEKQTTLATTLQANIDARAVSMRSVYAQYPDKVPQDIIQLFNLA